ncbi:MAG TPA: hypothetical protein PLE45_08395 [Spirochaetota bacterium]|nr:hypothetical protein [Spirochaetota bacterium]HPP04760.1 hypothetical protein [Spirochaetota bacterium]
MSKRILNCKNNDYHELHFVTTSKMKEKLAKIAKKENISLSKLICYVLQKFSDRVKKRYCFGCEDENVYERIDADASIHFYLPKEDYRFLKKIHADLNFFSMAKLIRSILEIFIEEYEKMGMLGFEKRCGLITLRLWLKLTEIKRWWKSRELSHFKGNFTPFYKAIYNNCYQVIGFETYY